MGIIWLLLIVAGIKILAPLIADSGVMLQELIRAREQCESPQALLDEIATLNMNNAEIASQIKGALKNVPSTTQMSSIYEELNASAEKSGIRLTRITPQPLQTEAGFRSLEIEATIHANFNDLLYFFHEIESQKGLFRIKKLEMEEARENRFDLEGQVQLSAYLQ